MSAPLGFAICVTIRFRMPGIVTAEPPLSTTTATGALLPSSFQSFPAAPVSSRIGGIWGGRKFFREGALNVPLDHHTRIGLDSREHGLSIQENHRMHDSSERDCDYGASDDYLNQGESAQSTSKGRENP